MSSINGIKNSEAYSPESDYLDQGTGVSEDDAGFGIEDEYGLDGSDRDLGALESNGASTVMDLHQQLSAFLKSLSPEQKEQYKAQIEGLKKELTGLRGNAQAPAHLLESFAAMQGEAMGGEEFGGEMGEDGMADGTVSEQVAALKAQVEGNDKIDEATKKLLLGKLDDVANIESISPDQAQEKLDGLIEQVQNYTNFSPAAMRLNQELGLEDPAAVQEMLDKHGVDGSAQTIDPARLEMVMNDPLITEAVAAEQDAHETAYKTMNDMVAGKISEAHAVNQATDQKDSSMILDTDTSAFQWLYETQPGVAKSKEAKATNETAVALAEKKASILSALTNSEVKADPEQPGIVRLPVGGQFNAVQNKLGGGPAFEWPPVEMVEFHADVEGDGQTQFPDWMKQAKYPHHATDVGGVGFAAVFLTVLSGGVMGPVEIGLTASGEVPYQYEADDPYAN